MSENSKKVLVVEDDNMLRNIMVDKMKTLNAVVLQADDGEKALQMVFNSSPHLILLDLMLPKVDGFEVLETIRNSPDPLVSRTHVVVLSNLWSNKDILRVRALKIDEYFVKANTDLQVVYKKAAEILGMAT